MHDFKIYTGVHERIGEFRGLHSRDNAGLACTHDKRSGRAFWDEQARRHITGIAEVLN